MYSLGGVLCHLICGGLPAQNKHEGIVDKLGLAGLALAQRMALDLVEQHPGERLRSWCAANVPSGVRMSPDDLVGEVLTESIASEPAAAPAPWPAALAAPPPRKPTSAPPRARSRSWLAAALVGLLAFGFTAAVAVTALVWASGVLLFSDAAPVTPSPVAVQPAPTPTPQPSGTPETEAEEEEEAVGEGVAEAEPEQGSMPAPASVPTPAPVPAPVVAPVPASEAAPAPEVAPALEPAPAEAAASLAGVWSGRAAGQPISLNLSQSASSLSGSITLTSGTQMRREPVSGSVHGDGSMHFRAGDLSFKGSLSGESLVGTYQRDGAKKPLAWAASR